MLDLGPNLFRLAQNGTNLGLYKICFSPCTETDVKNPRFVPCLPNLTHFGPKREFLIVGFVFMLFLTGFVTHKSYRCDIGELRSVSHRRLNHVLPS